MNGRGDATERRLILGALWIVVYTLLLGGWLLAKPGAPFFFLAGEDALRVLGPLVLLPVCFTGVDNLWRKGSTRWKLEHWLPLLLGLAVFAFVVARAVRFSYEVVLRQTVPTPSVADIGFLIAYPCLFAAILILPGPTFSRASRTRIALDASLVVSGLAAFAWYFILGPSVLAAHGTILAKAVNGAYPLFDIALASCLLLLSTLSEDLAYRRVATVLGGALMLLVTVDSIREYQMLHGTYISGTLLDLGRPVAFMLVCLAAAATRLVEAPTAQAPNQATPPQREIRGLKRVPQAWRYMLPYCSVPAIVALMIYAARSPGNPRLALGVYIAGAMLIELVLLHQFLDYRELIAFASRNARLESLAAADPVTGLPNHRTVVAALDREFVRSRRYQHPCAVLFMDLDHFKALNDSYGHPAGDAALREFGSVVRSALRGADMLGRWGGEEFVAVLPETSGEAALAVAERVRTAVAAHTFWAAGGAHLTCSVGVAAYPDDAGSRDVLVEKADQAMYVAKRLGRNQVCSATDPVVSALSGEVGPSLVREEATLAGMVEALVAVLEAHHPGSSQHLQEVAALCARLALELGLDTSNAHMAGLAGRLHDVGEVAIPSHLLDKPEPLSEEEWLIVRRHPSVGAAIVGRVPKLASLAPVIRAHHEWWDGTGYPDGLAGESIPLCARILAVAEAYIAMISDRPYGAARSPALALDTLLRAAGTQFDPEVVNAAHRVLTGATVEVVA